jgi:hypothetical protein
MGVAITNEMGRRERKAVERRPGGVGEVRQRSQVRTDSFRAGEERRSTQETP